MVQLKELLDQKGVAYKSSDNKATLIQLLEGAV
ncbi:MAG: HeH/LEM domain-containing protein [Pseudolactococcus laudensis]